MTKEQLLAKLKECAYMDDPERAHGEADDALLEYINDAEITAVFNAFDKWYA
jgi:hypothetical protein